MKYVSLLFLCLCLPLLAACESVSYTYIPPGGADSSACAMTCGEHRKTCESLQLQRYDECMSDRRNDSIVLGQCGQTRISMGCRPSPPCGAPNFDKCTPAYNECWTRCGGRVIQSWDGGEKNSDLVGSGGQ